MGERKGKEGGGGAPENNVSMGKFCLRVLARGGCGLASGVRDRESVCVCVPGCKCVLYRLSDQAGRMERGEKKVTGLGQDGTGRSSQARAWKGGYRIGRSRAGDKCEAAHQQLASSVRVSSGARPRSSAEWRSGSLEGVAADGERRHRDTYPVVSPSRSAIEAGRAIANRSRQTMQVGRELDQLGSPEGGKKKVDPCKPHHYRRAELALDRPRALQLLSQQHILQQKVDEPTPFSDPPAEAALLHADAPCKAMQGSIGVLLTREGGRAA